MKQQGNTHARTEQIRSRILQELHPSQLLPSLTAGIIVGMLVIILEISFAALIFSGDLAGYVSNGIGFTLFGGFVFCIVVALTSSFPGMVAIPQDSPVAILALAAAAIASNMSASVTSENIFPTVVVMIIVTSLLTGIFLLVLGIFNLGRLIRFIPYPVVGGFLAGTGWLLLKGGIGVMTDVSLNLSQLPLLFQTDSMIKWVPGLLFAILLLLILRRYSHFLIMPAIIFAGIGGFYLLLLLTKTSLAEAGAQGFLLGPFPESGLWQPLKISDWTQVDWVVIFGQLGSIGTILLISVISLLLNASGLELSVDRDIDLNKELRSGGIANLLAGFGGSPAGYQALSLSALGHKLGSHSRLVGLFSATLCGVTLFFGASLLSFFPKFVLGGLLAFLGIAFLTEWVYDAWFKLPRTDYVLVLLILGVVGMFGFLEGVTVGIVVAVVLFVIKYSRINVVKHVLSGTNYQSNVDRAVPHRRLLQEKGEQLLILKLQGFVFFGTADTLLNQVRQRATNPELPALRFVILDFHLVTGLDSSALNSFAKMRQLAEARHIILVLTDLSPQIQRQFEIGGDIREDDPVFRISPDLDHGVEWCEEQTLIAENHVLTDTKDSTQEQYGLAFLESIFEDMMKFLDKQEMFESIVAGMSAYFERQEVEEGYYLIRRGDPPEAVYFIESGQVTAQLEGEDSKMTRLVTMSAGTVVGEIGLYLEQQASASVIVEQSGTVHRLSIEALNRMKEHDPQLATLFHKFMARHLSERVMNLTNMLQAVLD